MDQPKIPTLKDSQKPQVKIKGLAAGLSLFDRLKQFKKKDLAFILAGLGTLFMAPLAEHFMMAPESGDGTMTQGWGGKGGSNLFGGGGSPYESGITGLAPGGAIGGGGDVITPLNVRDPSALVMGPGSQQQPPAGSLAPQQPPMVSTKEPDLKDALANAAARAAGAATRKAALPVPKPGMTGSGLRGLGVVSGGSSAGAGLAPISATNAPNRAAGSNSLSDVRPLSNYKGVARGPGSGSSGDALKKAAGNAADIFNRGGGSAAGNLETAAAQQMPGGGAFGGAGGGGAGGSDKGPGGNNNGGSKSVGESLDFLRQKSEQEKAIDLKWKMKEKRAMFPLELGQEAAKTAVMKGVVEPLSGMFGDLIKNQFGGTTTKIVCDSGGPFNLSQVKTGNGHCSGDTSKGSEFYWYRSATGYQIKNCAGTVMGEGCRTAVTGAGDAGAGNPSERGAGIDPYSSVGQGGSGYTGVNLTTICNRLTNTERLPNGEIIRPSPVQEYLLAQAKELAKVIEAVQGAGPGGGGSGNMMTACGATADADRLVRGNDAKIQWGGRGAEIATHNIGVRQTKINEKITVTKDVMGRAAEAWATGVYSAKTGISAQAEVAKTANPNFSDVDGQVTANLTGDNGGSNVTTGFPSLKQDEVSQVLTEIETTSRLIAEARRILPTATSINGGGTLDVEAQAVLAGGVGTATLGDLRSLAVQQDRVLTGLQAEQTRLSDRSTRLSAAYTEGIALNGNVTALLTPAGAQGNLAPVGNTPIPADSPSYNRSKTDITAAVQANPIVPPETERSVESLGRTGTIATGFNGTADALSSQIGARPAQGAGGAQGSAATGWASRVDAIVGAAAPAPPPPGPDASGTVQRQAMACETHPQMQGCPQ